MKIKRKLYCTNFHFPFLFFFLFHWFRCFCCCCRSSSSSSLLLIFFLFVVDKANPFLTLTRALSIRWQLCNIRGREWQLMSTFMIQFRPLRREKRNTNFPHTSIANSFLMSLALFCSIRLKLEEYHAMAGRSMVSWPRRERHETVTVTTTWRNESSSNVTSMYVGTKIIQFDKVVLQ